jgi:hypothetical protein
MKKTIFILGLLAGAALSVYAEAPNLLTYQGRLKENGLAVTGNRAVEIYLCDAETAGACTTTSAQPVAVTNGLFRSTFTVPAAVDLTTGSWWLELRVAGVTLTPRERLTSGAYALYAATAAYVADGSVTDAKIVGMAASKLTGALPALDGALLTNLPAAGGGVAKTGDTMTGQLTVYGASLTVTSLDGIRLENDARLTWSPPNEPNDSYITMSRGPGYFKVFQTGNETMALTNGHLAVAGNVAASTAVFSGDVTAASYQINGSTVLGLTVPTSLSVGVEAGRLNTGGSSNYIGYQAGYNNSTGNQNNFLGQQAGYNNTTGSNNTIVGNGAGRANLRGTENNYYGDNAGYNNSSGNRNSVYGASAGGGAASMYSSAALVGYMSGSLLTTGDGNTLVGYRAGDNLATGHRNIIIGFDQEATASTISDELNIGGVLRGSLAAGTIGIGAANTIPLAALDVLSTGTASNIYAQIWRNGSGIPIASMTSQGTLFATLPPGAGDNLGNHNATQNLQLNWSNILTVSSISARGDITAANYQIMGSTVLSMSGVTNIFVGFKAGDSNAAGTDNAYLGSNAASFNSGANNAVIGSLAGMGHAGETFSNSVLAGYKAGFNLGNASNNVLLGYFAGSNIRDGGGNIIIGANQLVSGSAADSNSANELNIGGVLFGDLAAKTIGISTRVPQAALDVVSTGTAQTQFAQIWRASDGVVKGSMSATGVMMAAKFVGDGAALTGLPANDDLGNHVATQNLNMSGQNIDAAAQLTVSTITGPGSAYVYVNQNLAIPGSYVAIGRGSSLSNFPLAVYGDAAGTIAQVLQLENKTALANSGIRLLFSGNGSGWGSIDVVDEPALGSTSMRFGTFNGELLRLYGTRAGIGSTTPDQKLTVAGNISQTGVLISSGSGDNYFAGRVGVGDPIPSYALDVTGSVNATASLCIADNCKSSWASIDNLGNHTATADLNMAQNDILAVTSMTLVGKGLQIGTDLTSSASGVLISTSGQILTLGLGNGTAAPNARGMGAVDLQTRRLAAAYVASGDYSVIAGGENNKASVALATIGGGALNSNSGTSAVIGGGYQNDIAIGYAAIVGGLGNTITSGASYSFIGAGSYNLANGNYSSLAGGESNNTSNAHATVAGGRFNHVAGQYGTVPGGYNNTADGNYSFAAGAMSSSTAQGAFTWNDSGGATVRLLNAVTDRTLFKNRGGFIVTGSTNTNMLGTLDRGMIITGSGLVGISTGVPWAALDVVSSATASNVYAQIWRNASGVVVASMTSQGTLYLTAAGTGDNLGDHTATADLNLAQNDILSVASMTMVGKGLQLATGLLSTDSGVFLSTSGQVVTLGLGNGTAQPNARGIGAVDLQTARAAATKVAAGPYSVISGGSDNSSVGSYSTVSGGLGNNINASSVANGVIAGGTNNNIWGVVSSPVIGGGSGNQINNGATYSVIAGGDTNTMLANASNAVISGGSNNIVLGQYAMVPGGRSNVAQGNYSFAAGFYSSATAQGAFTWADSAGVMIDNNAQDRTVFKNRGGFMVTGSTSTNMLATVNRGVMITGSGLVGISTGVPYAALDVVSSGTAANVYAQIWRNGGGTVVASMTSTGNLGAARYQINGSTVLALLPGSGSLALGVDAGKNNSGMSNTLIGSGAGGAGNDSGGSNVFVGQSAGSQNFAGNANSFLGTSAGANNTRGENNAYVGKSAAFYTRTGSANSVLGAEAGFGVSNNSFSSSTLAGYQAGYSLTTGNDNILLGFRAGYAVTTGTGNIVIGYDKGTSAPAANNELNIGGVLFGDLAARTIGISTRVPQAALDIVATGNTAGVSAQLWRNSAGVAVATVTATGRISGRSFVSGVQAVDLNGGGTPLSTFSTDGSGMVLLTQTADNNAIDTISGCDSGVVAQGQQVLFLVQGYGMDSLTFNDTGVAVAGADYLVLSSPWAIVGDSGRGSTITLVCTTISGVKAWVETGRSVNSD